MEHVETEELPSATPLAAVAFVAPFALVSALLPDPWRMYAWGLLTLFALLLVAASAWCHFAARERGLDPVHWGFLGIVTLGAAMFVVVLAASPTFLGRICIDCGREGAHDEAFCFGCGAAHV